MSWGKGLTIFIILFILTMSGMVYYAMKQDNQMIDSNYYDKEIQYQHLIDGNKRLRARYHAPLMADSSNYVQLYIPSAIFPEVTNGHIEMIRFDNQKLDRTIPIALDSSGVQHIDKSSMAEGMYRFRITWTHNSETFYTEEDIFVKKIICSNHC